MARTNLKPTESEGKSPTPRRRASSRRPRAAERETAAPAADTAAPESNPAVEPVAEIAAEAPPPAESAATGTATAREPTAAPPGQRRFDIFIIDVGWNSPVATSLRSNLDTCLRYQVSSTVYILTPDQCAAFFKQHPASIGTEPSIIVVDREAWQARRPQGFGFKLNFGLIRDLPSANNLLKWVLAVLAEQRPGSDITEPIRTVVHKEGFRGAIDILADIARSPVGEAMTH